MQLRIVNLKPQNGGSNNLDMFSNPLNQVQQVQQVQQQVTPQQVELNKQNKFNLGEKLENKEQDNEIDELGPGIDRYQNEIIHAQNNGAIPGLSEIIIDKEKDHHAGSGAFATKDFKEGDIVEVCPLVRIPYEHIRNNGLNDYVFSLQDASGDTACVLGYGAVYNHDDNPSLTYVYSDNNKFMIYKATRDIKNGEELTVSYGDGWWNARQQIQKQNQNQN